MAMKTSISSISLSLLPPKPNKSLTLTPPFHLSFPTRTRNPTLFISSPLLVLTFAQTNPWSKEMGEDDEVVLDSLGEYMLLEGSNMGFLLERIMQKASTVCMLSEEDVEELINIFYRYDQIIEDIENFAFKVKKKSPRKSGRNRYFS